jgi:hypothetical protein
MNAGPRGRWDFPEAIIAMAGARGGWGGGPGGGWGSEWSQWGGGRGRGGGPRRGGMFRPGELRLVLLRLISDQPRHGYDPHPIDRGDDRRRLCAKPRASSIRR